MHTECTAVRNRQKGSNHIFSRINYKNRMAGRISFEAGGQSAVFGQMAFKILRKNFCGLDVHKTWIFACIGITDSNGRTEYKQSRFFSFTKGCMIGLPNTIAWASAWNPRRNAGFPYSISLKRPAVSLWPTPNTQSRRRATKPTARTPSESATCICAAWSSPALYHRPTSTSFGT